MAREGSTRQLPRILLYELKEAVELATEVGTTDAEGTLLSLLSDARLGAPVKRKKLEIAVTRSSKKLE